MAKLKDLIKLDDQQDIIKIRGIELPIAFDMRRSDNWKKPLGLQSIFLENAWIRRRGPKIVNL